MSYKICLRTKNGKGNCPPYDGPCDYGGRCTSGCRQTHRRYTNKARRLWDKKIIKQEVAQIPFRNLLAP